MYAVDAEWRIEYMNERMAARVDRDPAAVVGTRLWDEFPSIVDTELETLYRDAMATGEAFTTEQWLGNPFGYFVEVRAFPDDGVGVPPEDRASVFEHGNTTTEDGTGLGLSIVQDIAGAHGWTVDVETGRDGGARFVVDTTAGD